MRQFCRPTAPLRPPEPQVRPPGRAPGGGIQHVAPVDDGAPPGQTRDNDRVELAVLVPFRDEHHDIRPATSRAGESRMSSEYGLKASPSTATFFS